MAKISEEQCQQALDTYAAFGSNAYNMLGITKDQLDRRRAKGRKLGLVPAEFGSLDEQPIVDRPLPKKGQVSTYILTSIQSNTSIFSQMWKSLNAIAGEFDAEILVGRMRYNKTSGQVAQEETDGVADSGYWYAKEADDHIQSGRVRLCKGLIWFGDMNTMPTASVPLSSLDSIGGDESCIFPHTKIAMKPISRHPSKPHKLQFATGAITKSNYIQRKAGKKAEFHHAYAALMIHVDSDGNWYPQTLNADSRGEIYFLGFDYKPRRASGNKIIVGNFVDVFCPGDIHAANVEKAILDHVWGKSGMIDRLRPKNQVLHDLLDFESQSHHGGVFEKLKLHLMNRDNVSQEIKKTYAVLKQIERPFVKTHIVSANHNDHLDRWVNDASWKHDPQNAEFYLSAAGAKCGSYMRERFDFNMLQWALERVGPVESNFLGRLDSLIINGVRYDQHFDIGSNGSRGSVNQFAKTGEKSVGGHSHSPWTVDGAMQVGTFAKLRMNYVQGLSSWAQSCAIQFKNAKRGHLVWMNGSFLPQGVK